MSDAAQAPALQPPAALGATPFEFVRTLAAELSRGEVKLPSFPDLVLRVRQVLDDPRATPAQVARVVSADAALAARVLRLANSATFNPTGQPVTELRTAIARLGHEVVRCAAVQFALAQVREAREYRALRPQLQELWRKGTLVATLACVLARATKATDPDLALVAGLLHNVGRLYIVTRAHLSASSLESSVAWDEVLHDWHPQIGRSILENWKFPEIVVEAVGEQNAWDRPRAPGGALGDVLVCAVALVPGVFYRALLDDTIGGVPAFQRLGLDAAGARRLLAESAQQIKALRQALAG